MSYNWKLHLLGTYCHRVPHLPHNKPFFTFFNNNSSSSSPTYIPLFHQPFFKLLNNISSLYSVTSLYFSTKLSFLFRKPFSTFFTNLVSQTFLHQYFFPRLTELSNYLSCIPFYLLPLTLLFILPTFIICFQTLMMA